MNIDRELEAILGAISILIEVTDAINVHDVQQLLEFISSIRKVIMMIGVSLTRIERFFPQMNIEAIQLIDSGVVLMDLEDDILVLYGRAKDKLLH